MDGEEHRKWFAIMRVQPWRRHEALPPPPPLPRIPAPPSDRLLRVTGPQVLHHADLDPGSRRHVSPPFVRLDSARVDASTSPTAMRFLLRSPPHVPRRQDRGEDPYASSRYVELDPLARAATSAIATASQPQSRRATLAPVSSLVPQMETRRDGAFSFKCEAATCSPPTVTDAMVRGRSGSFPIESSRAWSPWQPDRVAGTSPHHGWRETVSACHVRPDASIATTKSCQVRVAQSANEDEDALSPGLRDLETTGRPNAASPHRKTKKKKRTPRVCTTPGCDKLVVDHGVCIRHGGGKRCNVEGCTCRAQNKGLCWKHGGYTICRIDGCDKRAKSRGMCWSHGGGTQCKTDACEKIAVSRGRCWAHGGGKRCKVSECQKPAALRLNDYCAEHYAKNRLVDDQQQSVRRLDFDPLLRYADLQDVGPRK